MHRSSAGKRGEFITNQLTDFSSRVLSGLTKGNDRRLTQGAQSTQRTLAIDFRLELRRAGDQYELVGKYSRPELHAASWPLRFVARSFPVISPPRGFGNSQVNLTH